MPSQRVYEVQMMYYVAINSHTDEVIGTAPSQSFLETAFPDAVIVEHPEKIDPKQWYAPNGVLQRKPDAEIEQQEIDEAWWELRSQRNRKLQLCDWTQVPDAPVDQAAWAAYRQALRDLPENTLDPQNPVWPDAPK